MGHVQLWWCAVGSGGAGVGCVVVAVVGHVQLWWWAMGSCGAGVACASSCDGVLWAVMEPVWHVPAL